MGFDIFLSYSRVDQAVADEFFKAASKRGLTLWYDQLLQGGEDWRDGIVKALSQSKVLVILFSDASNSSIQLIKELAVADSVGKTVIPVLIENTEPKGAYLYELAARNWIRLYPNPIRKMDELVSTIEVQLKELTGTQGGQATVNPAPPARRAESSAVASVAWIPFKTYDALFLFLLAVNALCHASGITYGASPTPAGWNIVLILLYLLLLAARNAQLNRGIFSAKSFFSYVTTISLVIPFALLPDKINGAKEANAALAVTLLVAAFIVGLAANIVQVILRPIFQRFLFRKRIAGLPANAL